MPFIERRAGVKFERIGAPQPQEMARIAGMCSTLVFLRLRNFFSCDGREGAPLAWRQACWIVLVQWSHCECANTPLDEPASFAMMQTVTQQPGDAVEAASSLCVRVHGARHEMPPSPTRAGERAVEALMAVDRSVVPWFRGAAQQLLAAVDSPEEALAMALARVTGHSVLQARVCLCRFCLCGGNITAGLPWGRGAGAHALWCMRGM